MTQATGQASVTVRREIDAPAEMIFDAWLDPDSLAAWMRPGGIPRSTAKVDPRAGGAFEIVMHAPAGPIVHTGTYRVIDRPKRLVFTWISPATEHRESLVTVELRAASGGTEISVTHEQLPDKDAVRSHHEGWSDALGLLALRVGAAGTARSDDRTSR